MNSRLLGASLLAGLGLLALLLLGNWALEPAPSSPATAPPPVAALPAITLNDLDGTPRPLAAWRGKVVLLNFWATWCPPCRDEIPDLQALQQAFGGRGMQVVGIAIDDPAAVRPFVDELAIDYPVLVAGEEGIALSRQLGNRFGGLPFTVVADRDGRLVLSHAGRVTRERLEPHIEPLL